MTQAGSSWGEKVITPKIVEIQTLAGERPNGS
jgi:hypothetical protein